MVAQTVKKSSCNAGNQALIPGSGRCPGGNGNPLQYSCLENSMDRGAFKFVLFSRDPVVSQFLFLFFEKLHADWAPKTLFAWEIQYNQTGVE